MKKIIFALVALAVCTISFAQQKVVTKTTVIDEDNYVSHYVYNAEGNPILIITEGLSQQIMTYNDFGQMVQQDYFDLTDSRYNRTYVYKYNEIGQVESEEELAGDRSLGTTTYTYDNHGNVVSTTNSRAGMPISRRNTYDNDGHLIKMEIPNPMNPSVVMQATEYVYEGNILTSEAHYSSEILVSTTIYTYSQDLLVNEIEKDPAENVTSRTDYLYSDIDVSFAPQNVNAVANEGNTITVTWEGAANAVIIGSQYFLVRGQNFTSPVLLDGQYTIYVVNNGNALVTDPIDVIDNTKVGVSNVRRNGDIYASNETILDYYGEPKDVIAYNIPIAWDLPDTQKPTGYRIYYNSTYSVEIEDGSLRSYTIPAVNTSNYVMGQGVVTIPFEIRIIAIYATGEVEPANVISFTLDETEEILNLQPVEDAINTIKTGQSSSQWFDLSGRHATKNAHSILIQRQGGQVRKVLPK